MVPPQESKTRQDYELRLGTNNVTLFLFTKLLTSLLLKTAKVEPPGTVRVVWTSSSIAEAGSPKNGIDMDNLNYAVDKPIWHKYSVSKAGNILHSKEFASRYAGEGLISVVYCLPRRHDWFSAYYGYSSLTLEILRLPSNDMSLVGRWRYLTLCYIPRFMARIQSCLRACRRM